MKSTFGATILVFKAAFVLGALEQSFSGALQEVSWSVLRHSSSGFSLSQFVLFLHVIPDRLMMIRSDLCVQQIKISLDYYN